MINKSFFGNIRIVNDFPSVNLRFSLRTTPVKRKGQIIGSFEKIKTQTSFRLASTTIL